MDELLLDRPNGLRSYWTFGLFAGALIAFQLFAFFIGTYLVLEIASPLFPFEAWQDGERDAAVLLWSMRSAAIWGPLAVGLATNKIVGACLSSERRKAAFDAWVAAGAPAVDVRHHGPTFIGKTKLPPS